MLVPLLGLGIGFALGTVYSSLFEWALHRVILHSPRFLKYPHRAHQLEHHMIFRADATYFLPGGLHEKGDEKHLTFAWWSAPLLIGLHLPLFVGLYFAVGGFAASAFFGAMIVYYALYEYFHYCMHVPKTRWIERTRFFRSIQAHHRYHHVYYRKNLNVVLPLWDFILRTRGVAQDRLFEKLEDVRQRRQDRALREHPQEPLPPAPPVSVHLPPPPRGRSPNRTGERAANNVSSSKPACPGRRPEGFPLGAAGLNVNHNGNI